MSQVPGSRVKSSDNMPTPTYLGYALRRFVRRWMSYPGHWDTEKRFVCELDRKGVAQWKIEYRPLIQRKQSLSAGDAGDGVSVHTPHPRQSNSIQEIDLRQNAGDAGDAGDTPNVHAHARTHARTHAHACEDGGGSGTLSPASPAKVHNSNDSKDLLCRGSTETDPRQNEIIPGIPGNTIAENTPCPRCSQLLRSRESFVCRDCGYTPPTTQPETPQ